MTISAHSWGVPVEDHLRHYIRHAGGVFVCLSTHFDPDLMHLPEHRHHVMASAKRSSATFR